MTNSVISPAMRDERAGEVFGDMHELVDDSTNLVVIGEFVKMM